MSRFDKDGLFSRISQIISASKIKNIVPISISIWPNIVTVKAFCELSDISETLLQKNKDSLLFQLHFDPVDIDIDRLNNSYKQKDIINITDKASVHIEFGGYKYTFDNKKLFYDQFELINLAAAKKLNFITGPQPD